jgi:hypothetical protein
VNIADARREFPALQNQIFMDSACVGLLPQHAAEFSKHPGKATT